MIAVIARILAHALFRLAAGGAILLLILSQFYREEPASVTDTEVDPTSQVEVE